MPYRSRRSRPRRVARTVAIALAAAVVLGGAPVALAFASSDGGDLPTSRVLHRSTAASPVAAVVRTATAVHGWPAAPTSATVGTTYRAHLRVSGSHRDVRLERKLDGVWRTVDRERTTASGRVTLAWHVPASAKKPLLRVHVIHTATRRAAITRPKPVVVHSAASTSSAETLRAQLLTLVDEARSKGRTCGSTAYPAAKPLHRSAALDTAAGGYAAEMATKDFFSHTGPDGSTMVSRLKAVGITNTTERENIAAGQTSASSVMAAWLSSPGHCANLMASDVTRIGFGHATSSTSTFGQYWVQDLAG